MKPYYYVHRVNGGHPKIKHASLGMANAEAMRLAGQHPGASFEILKCVAVTMTTVPQTFWMDGEARNLEDQARIFALSRGLTIEEVARLSVSPMFCRRLMGYPVEWDSCGATAMQSSRNLRQSS